MNKQSFKILLIQRLVHASYSYKHNDTFLPYMYIYRNYPMFSDTLCFWTPPILHRYFFSVRKHAVISVYNTSDEKEQPHWKQRLYLSCSSMEMKAATPLIYAP